MLSCLSSLELSTDLRTQVGHWLKEISYQLSMTRYDTYCQENMNLQCQILAQINS